MSRLDLLITLEPGSVPSSRTWAELLFEVLSQRYGRGSIMATASLLFGEWTEDFGSERLTGALQARLTHRFHSLGINGNRYRLRRRRKNAASQASEEREDEQAKPRYCFFLVLLHRRSA